MATNFKNIVVVGPTGSGKSRLALELAHHFNGELIGCDSVQIYKGFDIGSAKDKNTAPIAHHLIDLIAWDEEFDAAMYAQAAQQCQEDIISRGKVPIIVGGTGLYLRAFWGQGWSGDIPKDREYRLDLESQEQKELYAQLQKTDPRRASEIHFNDKFRTVRALEINKVTSANVPKVVTMSSGTMTESLVIKIEPDRKLLHQRIATRSAKMLQAGLLSEVQDLLASGVAIEAKPMQSIGYKQIMGFFNKEIPEAELCDRIIFATRQYAKRQTTWFRKTNAHILTPENTLDAIRNLLPISL